MLLFTLADQAQLAQSTVASILDHACRQSGGERTLAEAANVSVVFLSNIRHQKQMPSLSTARRIAVYLPLTLSEQIAWLDTVQNYWNVRDSSTNAARRVYYDHPESILEHVLGLHIQGRYSNTPEQTRRHLELVIEVLEPLVQTLEPEYAPLIFARLCSILHEAYLASGQIVNGLKLARYTRWIFDGTAFKPDLRDRHEVAMHQVRTLYMEMVSLNELHLFHQAQKLSFEIERGSAFSIVRRHWTPVLYWDRIYAMAHIPRFSIFEAEHLARQARLALDESVDSFQDVASLLIMRSLGEAHIKHGNWKKAKLLLMSALQKLPSCEHLGVLHNVLFLQTLARFYWSMPRREMEQWQRVIDEARRLAVQAGLNSQLHHINEEYGSFLSDELV